MQQPENNFFPPAYPATPAPLPGIHDDWVNVVNGQPAVEPFVSPFSYVQRAQTPRPQATPSPHMAQDDLASREYLIDQAAGSTMTPAHGESMLAYLDRVERLKHEELAAIRHLRSQIMQGCTHTPDDAVFGRRRAMVSAPELIALARTNPFVVAAMLVLAPLLAFILYTAFNAEEPASSSAAHSGHSESAVASSDGEHASPNHDDAKGGGGESAHGHEAEKSVSGEGTRTAAAAALDVSLGEFFVRPSRKTVKAGTLKVKATNTGKVEHELMFIRSDRMPKDIASMSSHDLHGLVTASVHGLTPNTSKTQTVVLKRGSYVVFCNLPGHLKSGQRQTLQVT